MIDEGSRRREEEMAQHQAKYEALKYELECAHDEEVAELKRQLNEVLSG